MKPMFYTASGVGVPAVSADQMREVDRVAVEEIGLSLLQMMENAGRNLALSAIEMLGARWRHLPIVVLAGAGHNGGGGICAARHLANHGGEITVVIPDSARLATASAAQLHLFGATSGRVIGIGAVDTVRPVLIIDAVIGYGLRGTPRGTGHDLIAWSAATAVPKLSLDVPSGVDSTTGEAPGVHVVASRTVTLALPKTGLDVSQVGELRLSDIGIPVDVYDRIGFDVQMPVFDDGYVVALQAAAGG